MVALSAPKANGQNEFKFKKPSAIINKTQWMQPINFARRIHSTLLCIFLLLFFSQFRNKKKLLFHLFSSTHGIHPAGETTTVVVHIIKT